MNSDLDSPSDRTSELKQTLTQERSAWRLTALENLLRSFSPAERLALYILSTLLALSALVLIWGVNGAVSVLVPAQGGTLTEGELGPARFVNPVLTLSQPDQDITALVYSGLMRAMPDGTYQPDLASDYSVSQDGTTYTFHLRKGATFQDGNAVTAQDVLYTVQETQNPAISSPRRADWTGVQVSAPDDHTVVFKLPHAYAPFIENTTMGVLPKHVWSDVSAEEFPFNPANTHPIGSGPYRVVSVSTDSTGSVTRYDLVPFSRYALGQPYLSHITFLFFQNEGAMLDAFSTGRIDAVAGVSPNELSGVKRADAHMVRVALPRVFGVFFNQSHAPVLAEPAVRQALNAALNKKDIIDDVLNGYGVALQGPVPPDLSGNVAPATATPIPSYRDLATTTPDANAIASARAILQKGGWKFSGTATSSAGMWTKGKQTLSLALSTADRPELMATANDIAAAWRALGVKVTVQVYPLSELNQSVIRPRQYDALLFGEVVGRELDLFAFWHSSQRNDPGLNLAMYANSKADALLSQARATTDEAARAKLYSQFSSLVQKDVPAIFLYSPDFIYLLPQELKGVELGALTTPSERFLNVYQWYTETEHVWSIFVKE